jgi:hypothetical protein
VIEVAFFICWAASIVNRSWRPFAVAILKQGQAPPKSKIFTDQELKNIFCKHGVDDPSKPKINLTDFADDLAELFGASPVCNAVRAMIATTYRLQPGRFDENDEAELEALAGEWPPLPAN